MKFNFFNSVKLSHNDLSIIMAHALEYYDTALYGFLAPVLAPIFFPGYEPIVQLILTYSTLASSSFTRPIGSFIFGIIARSFGPTRGLSYSLAGMAISSILIGLLPGFSAIGWGAPLLLVMARMLRGFFAAGEGTIAKLYVLEGKPRHQALTISDFYQSSAMLGMVLASIAATLVIVLPLNGFLWRICFCLGGLTGMLGYLLRRNTLDDQTFANTQSDHFNLLQLVSSGFLSIRTLWLHRGNVLRVGLVTTFSYITYVVSFIFMNSFVPLITPISLETMMALNTALVILDMVMIPVIGRLLQRFEGSQVMIWVSLILAGTVVPLFNGLPDSSIVYVTGVRIWVVSCGVVFLCPMNFWL